MSLSSISSKSFFYEKMNVRTNQKAKEKEAGIFSENLEDNYSAAAEREASPVSVQVDYSYGSAESAIWMHQNGRVNMNAVFECKARHITYSESDLVKIFAAEGYTLKAKVDMDAHMVYIEQKNENGNICAYEVNPLKLSDNTKNPIEQMAAEAWQKARDLLNDGTFTEVNTDMEEAEEEDNLADFKKMLEEFHEFVKKRIKEGPLKIQIGGSEFSEKEWEQLMKKIDEDIDAYKEELRQRIRKQKDAEDKGRKAGSATEVKSLAQIAGAETKDDEIKETEVSEEEIIEAPQGKKSQASTSFLARLSGQKKAPYSYLADESGNIVYKGAVFVCDDKKQSICLGDMSDPNRVLNIPLAKGGTLRVNVDNIGDLVKAVDMFSPEDIARILKAIARYKKIENMELEIEEMKSKDPTGNAEGTSGASD